MNALHDLKEYIDTILFRKPEVYLSIEGNIGAGKSTLVNELTDELDNLSHSLIEEPVKSWQMFNETNSDTGIDVNILQRFYEDKKRWSYTMQTLAFLTRTYWIMNSPKVELKISERSIFTDYDIFGKLCYDEGNMSTIEKQIYDFWFKWLIKVGKEAEYNIEPDGFIYLKTTPQKCFERIKERNRPEECDITLEYLEKLHDYHEKFFNKLQDKGIPVLVLDGDLESDSDVNGYIYRDFAEEIIEFANEQR